MTPQDCYIGVGQWDPEMTKLKKRGKQLEDLELGPRLKSVVLEPATSTSGHTAECHFCSQVFADDAKDKPTTHWRSERESLGAYTGVTPPSVMTSKKRSRYRL